MQILNSDYFIGEYENTFGKMKDAQKDGLKEILRFMESDGLLSGLEKNTAIKRMAYILATTKHECDNTWKPIREYGQGRGREYGKPVKFTDSSVSPPKVHYHIYYGRGYCQLTWLRNYEEMSRQIFGDNRLAANPDLALSPETAYKIMSYGMTYGKFTGVSFDKYTPIEKDKKTGKTKRGETTRLLSETKTDYYNSRRIINGLDKAEKIAADAVAIEKMIRASIAEPKESALDC